MHKTTSKTLTVKILTLLVKGTRNGACFNMSFARVFSIAAWTNKSRLGKPHPAIFSPVNPNILKKNLIPGK